MDRVSSKKTVRYENIIDYEKKGSVCAVRVIKLVNDKEVGRDSFFASWGDIKKNQKGKNLTVATFNIDRDRQYFLFDPERFKAVEDCFARGVQFYEELNDASIKGDAIELMQSEEYDPKWLIRFKSYDHTFFRLGQDKIMSMPYRVDYIGGVTNGNFDLDRAEEILRKNKYVYNVERIDIPYYNADSGNDRAVEFSVRLTQQKLNNLLKYEKGHCRVKDLFAGFYMWKDYPDILGLGKALLPESARRY
jgi:hypothetical protein